MTRRAFKAFLFVWAFAVGLALCFVIRGCSERGAIVVRVEVPRIEFVER